MRIYMLLCRAIHLAAKGGANVRIPWQVAAEGKGYMEDRRPCANINPYAVLAKIIETVMEG